MDYDPSRRKAIFTGLKALGYITVGGSLVETLTSCIQKPEYKEGKLVGEHGFIAKMNNPESSTIRVFDELPYVIEIQTPEQDYFIELVQIDKDKDIPYGTLEKELIAGTNIEFPIDRNDFLFGGMNDIFKEKTIGGQKFMYGKIPTFLIKQV